MAFELVLPFLRPIAHLITDPDVSEVMVNGLTGVFVERAGIVTAVAGVQLSERNLRVAVKNIARAVGDDISDEQPILDARLPDGPRGDSTPAVSAADAHHSRSDGSSPP